MKEATLTGFQEVMVDEYQRQVDYEIDAEVRAINRGAAHSSLRRDEGDTEQGTGLAKGLDKR